jgi:ferredoxin
LRTASLAQKLGVTSVRYPYSFPKVSVDMSHERYVLDHNRCILCTRCVRACGEVEGAHVWDVRNRGVGSRLVCELNQEWGSSRNCTACGKCVNVCPTGAMAERAGRLRNDQARRTGQPVSRAARSGVMSKIKLATVWLDGCSGCHMSLLDIDEGIVAVSRRPTSCTGRWWTRRSFRRVWTSPWSRAPCPARKT